MITVERYRRFWAVYESGQLLCVTVYKKGATAVKDRLEMSLGYSVARRNSRLRVRSHRQRADIDRLLRFTSIRPRFARVEALRSQA